MESTAQFVNTMRMSRGNGTSTAIKLVLFMGLPRYALQHLPAESIVSNIHRRPQEETCSPDITNFASR